MFLDKSDCAKYERRFKIANLPVEALLNCLVMDASTPHTTLTKLSLDVPKDTVVVGRFWSPEYQAESVLLYNASWPLIPMTERVPIIEVGRHYIQIETQIPGQLQPLNPFNRLF